MNASSVTVGDNANKQVSASILETDKERPRSASYLIKEDGISSRNQVPHQQTECAKAGLKLVPLASEGLVRLDDVELGEDVLVAGYPYGELFSDTIKVTKGIVSANKGME